MYYAYLDENYYCIAISRLSGEIELNKNIIRITDYDINYLKRKYDIINNVWTDEYLREETIPLYSQQEIVNAQILTQLEYLTCLQELNSMKGGNL